MLCREGENQPGISICNFSLDEMANPVVHLAEKWTIAECIGLSGSLNGRLLPLDTIPSHFRHHTAPSLKKFHFPIDTRETACYFIHSVNVL